MEQSKARSGIRGDGMSVLIKGMEMPKCCEECVAGAYEYNDNDERCFVCGFIKSQHPWECEHVEIDGIDTTKARADFCPLIEVPTPHGRLVDLDKMIDRFWDGNSMEVFKSELEQIQTVIEAEE